MLLEKIHSKKIPQKSLHSPGVILGELLTGPH